MTTISNEELIEFLKRVSATPTKFAHEAGILLAKLQPPLRKIDISNLDQRVPVRVTAKGETLMDLFTKSGGVVLGFDSPILTLKTDRWIYNDLGTNPWPEGCVVEYESPSTRLTLRADARDLVWVKASIIASRYVGPAEGWEE